ncbi:MarR family protein [Halorubrum aquaticum]|uniref:MarR family protein n=1 Tax=Halorubrum aquaticum TaxID=387340 RepID=A0A1I3AZ05_9EURY|nr:MarR family transcriptional regulator [Halorubrum aquaticum]SFH55160.1 MarR family protein [Halorubrum aquaticum]
MNRRRADTVVGVFLGFVLSVGGALGWRAYRRRRAFEQSMGSMMDSSMGTMHGPDPLWYAVGTLLVVGGIGGVYLVVRGDLTDSEATDSAERIDPDPTSTETTASMGGENSRSKSLDPESDPRARVLDLLPDDERRVLEPVLNSPGITQIELRDRSDFSKSKVSQTVSSLEKRGLLYRERQGRTYRVYPSEDLQQQ